MRRVHVGRLNLRLSGRLGDEARELAREVAREALLRLHRELSGRPWSAQRVEEVRVPPLRLSRPLTVARAGQEAAAHVARAVAASADGAPPGQE